MATTSKNKASVVSARASSAMGQLLARHTNLFVTLKKGESIKGKISKLTPSEILVDSGAKTEAVVLEKDKRILRTILGMFKVGDTVEVNILNPESETGQPIVSLRRYLGNLAWKRLEELAKTKEQIEVTVSDVTKAGFLVNTDFGISGFLPQSHISYSPQHDIAPGMRINVLVLELNRTDNKIIFSQKATITEKEFANVVKQLKVGEKVDAMVTNITPFGIFASVPLPKAQKKDQELPETIEGFIHISEISWERQSDLSGMFTSGQKIEAVINRFDTDTRRINLSIKRLTKDPFDELISNFPVDSKVKGTVTKVEETGVSLTINYDREGTQEPVEGFIRKEKIPPMTTFTVGQKIDANVSEFDKKRHKIILTPVLLEKPIGYR